MIANFHMFRARCMFHWCGGAAVLGMLISLEGDPAAAMPRLEARFMEFHGWERPRQFEIMYDEGSPYEAMPLFWACYTDIHGCDVM